MVQKFLTSVYLYVFVYRRDDGYSSILPGNMHITDYDLSPVRVVVVVVLVITIILMFAGAE